jgi:hypothetical protein
MGAMAAFDTFATAAPVHSRYIRTVAGFRQLASNFLFPRWQE